MKILFNFNLMKSAISQTYYTVKTLLDVVELRSLGFNIIKTFNQIFPEIRDKINNIIPNRIEKVIYPKIIKFKNEANNLITKLFISTLEKEGTNLKDKLSSKIYELIPTQLDSSFKGIIQNNFNNAIKNIIEDIKQTYNTKILTDLKNISDTLNKYGDEVHFAISTIPIGRVSFIFYLMDKYYNKLKRVHIKYVENSVFEVKSKKIIEIESFINTKIINSLIYIKDGFYSEIEIRKENINKLLENFKLNTLIDSTLINVTNSELTTIIFKYQNLFTQLFTEFTNSISDKFSNFKNIFKEKTQNFIISGFDKKSSIRNLNEEYNLLYIEEVFLELEKYYETFSNNILNSKNYANIINIPCFIF